MAAQFALSRLQQHFRRRPDQYLGAVPSKVYQCSTCNYAWHLSSQEHAPVAPAAKLDAREQWIADVKRQAVADVRAFVEALDAE